MSVEKSCWNCSHKIGGRHCPEGRREEAKLRVRVLEIQEAVDDDEEAVEKLTDSRIKINIRTGKGMAARFVTLSKGEARERVESSGREAEPNGPYKGPACGNWEPREPYTVREMKEIVRRYGRRRERTTGEIEEYKEIRKRRKGGSSS